MEEDENLKQAKKCLEQLQLLHKQNLQFPEVGIGNNTNSQMWKSPKKFEHLPQLHQQNLPFPDIVVEPVNESPRRAVRSPSRFDHLQHLHQSNLNFPDLLESDEDDNLSIISVASSRCLEQLQRLHYQSLQFPDLLDDDDKWSTASSRCLDQLSMLHYRDRYCGLNTIQFLEDVRRDDTREDLSILTNLSSCSEMGSPEDKEPIVTRSFSDSPLKVLDLKSDLNIEGSLRKTPSPEKLTKIVEEESHLEESSSELASPTETQDPSLSTKVFVKNLNFSVKTKDLKEVFSAFGNVVRCHIALDHYQRKSRGFAFITYKTSDQAKRAIDYAATGNLIVNDRVLSVVPYISKKKVIVSSLEEMNVENGEDHTLKLTDDTLIIIFSYLNIRDRCMVERVCQRWKKIAFYSWAAVNSLDFRGVFSLGGRIMTDYVLRCILHKDCKSLKKLDFSTLIHRLSPYALDIIGKYAPTVEIFNLTKVPITKSKFEKLCNKCNIKSFTMVGCSDLGEKSLWTLLHKCTQLEELNINGNLRVQGTSFLQLPSSCISINLNSCNKILDESIDKMCYRCPHLKALYLNNCSNLSNTALKMIGQNLKKVEYFSLEGHFPKCNSQGLTFLENFEQLVELSLANNDLVNDHTLLIISTRCRLLEKLDISACYMKITDVGVDHLVLLKHLTILHMNYLNKVTDRSIQSLAENGYLEDFRARGCPTLTDTIMITISQNCLRIERVDVCGCPLITNQAVQAFYETSSLRPARHKLTLVIGETSIQHHLLPNDLRKHGIITDTISRCLGHFNFDGIFYTGRVASEYFSDSEDSESDLFVKENSSLDREQVIVPSGVSVDVEDFLTADDAFDECDGELT